MLLRELICPLSDTKLKIILEFVPLIRPANSTLEGFLVSVFLDQLEESLFSLIKLLALLGKGPSEADFMVNHILKTGKVVVVSIDG